MKIVYTAGRFRAPTPWGVHQNVQRAERAALEIANAGAMPLCPHMNTKNFDGLLTGEFWIEGTLELMKRSDAVYVFDPKWRDSQGTIGEILTATRRDIPVLMTAQTMRAWVKSGKTDPRLQLAIDEEAGKHFK